MGLTLSVFSLIYIFTLLFSKKDYIEGVGCLWMVTLIIFSFSCMVWGGTRYITPKGKCQHIYSDCISLKKSKKIKEVTELQGFFFWTFKDCKTCVKRRKEDALKRERIRAQERQSQIREERQEMKLYLQELIEELDNGATAEDILEDIKYTWDLVDENDTFEDEAPEPRGRWR